MFYLAFKTGFGEQQNYGMRCMVRVSNASVLSFLLTWKNNLMVFFWYLSLGINNICLVHFVGFLIYLLKLKIKTSYMLGSGQA